jgi:long-chain-fatty-acid--[acyl-carrier-protein] ligase
MLLLRGPSIFGGYLKYDGPSPFVDFDGHSWYRTGDLVHYDADGVFTFDGRLKRFVKLGGEMISLPAIEAALAEHCPPPDPDKGPVLAVEATPTDEHPEIVLFTTTDLSREQANTHIRAAGLSPLYSIRRVIRLEAIPVLGTGKTDYRALQEMLKTLPQ